MQPVSASIFTRTRRAFAACVLAGSIGVLLPACGSSGSSAAGSSNASSASSSTSSSSRYAARVKFASCMRSHGVNVPDPSANGAPGGGFGGGGGGGALRQALGTASGQAALKACASLQSQAFGFANITPAQRAQFQQAAVKFAQCMRAHNINIPDPTSNGAGGFGIFRSIPSSQRGSPAFQSAFTACASNLPNGGRFGRGGPGGSVGSPGA